MYDQNFGNHCSESTCRQKDFLPFTCKSCSKVFCLDHRQEAEHNCEQASKFQKKAMVCPVCKKTIFFSGGVHSEDEIWEIHNATECNEEERKDYEEKKELKVCQYDNTRKCKTKLNEINTFVCKTCNRLLCLNHRASDHHTCTPFPKGKTKQEKQKAAQVHQPVEKKLAEKQEESKGILGNMFSNLLSRPKPKNNQVQYKEMTRPVCHVCGKSFDDYFLLIQHAETAHQTQNNNQNNNNTNQNKNNNNNQNTMQQKEKCEICGQEFNGLEALIEHAEQKHIN